MEENGSVYTERINRVLDYIADHLDGDLSLGRLARVACFSRFHFHRIFHALTGETLNNHVRRIRLERAAALMKGSPRARVTDVALAAGFPGIAEFSRAFKSHFGLNASEWDRKSALPNSKNCKAPDGFPAYSEQELEAWRKNAGLEVKLKRFPACKFVYIRVRDAYGNQKLVDAYYKMLRWLAEEAVDMRDVVMVGMSQDDPAVTPKEKYRYDVSAAFPLKVSSAGLLGEIVRERGGSPRTAPEPAAGLSVRELPEFQAAVLRGAGDLAQVDRPWQYMYRCWLPHSRWEPAELPAMEAFVRLPEEIGWTLFELQACVPVREF